MRGPRAVLPEGSGVELLACNSDTDAGDSTQVRPSCVSVFTIVCQSSQSCVSQSSQ